MQNLLCPEQPNHGFNIGNPATAHPLQRLHEGNGKNIQKFVTIALVPTRSQFLSQKQAYAFLRIAYAGVHRPQTAPFICDIASFFQQFALPTGQRLLARVNLAGWQFIEIMP